MIGLFESTIQSLVALATLMPIVASIGGNTGNQTVALVIRALALDQLQPDSRRHLLRKELIVGLVNGLAVGDLVGLFAVLALSAASPLGLVMTARGAAEPDRRRAPACSSRSACSAPAATRLREPACC